MTAPTQRTPAPGRAPTLGACATAWFDKQGKRLFDCLAAAIDGRDPEGVHDMRVATRRLRAALEVFAPWITPADADPIGRRLRRLGRALGRTREIDVALLELGRAGARTTPQRRLAIEEVSAYLVKRRRKARRRMIRAFAAVDLDRLRQALETLPREHLEESASALPFAALAAAVGPDLLTAARRVVAAAEARAEAGSAAALEILHATRIDAKRLRYRIEILRPGLGAAAGGALAALRRLQDHLGALHDDSILVDLLTEVGATVRGSSRVLLAAELRRLHGLRVQRLCRDEDACRHDLATLATSGFVETLEVLLREASAMPPLPAVPLPDLPVLPEENVGKQPHVAEETPVLPSDPPPAPRKRLRARSDAAVD